jgi:hypothetical protein
MKIFLMFQIVLAFIITQESWAQMSTRPSPKDTQPQEDFEKFHKRLRIGYFGVLSTPNLREIDKGNWKNAALSPEFSDGTNKDSWPTNIWHQLSFNYNFGAKMGFVFNPRFVTPLADPETFRETGEDRSQIMMEDFLVGFQGVVFSSEDKSFNLWIRPGLRLPTSRASRNSPNGDAGTTTHQVELAYLPTYDFNKTWGVGIFGQFRQWVIEDQYGFDRFRFYTAPYVQYTIDDLSKIQVYFEHMWEIDRRKNENKNAPFKDFWQNIFIGYARDITPKLNVMPFVATFVNDVPLSNKSVWFGAWISASFK